MWPWSSLLSLRGGLSRLPPHSCPVSLTDLQLVSCTETRHLYATASSSSTCSPNPASSQDCLPWCLKNSRNPPSCPSHSRFFPQWAPELPALTCGRSHTTLCIKNAACEHQPCGSSLKGELDGLSAQPFWRFHSHPGVASCCIVTVYASVLLQTCIVTLCLCVCVVKKPPVPWGQLLMVSCPSDIESVVVFIE